MTKPLGTQNLSEDDLPNTITGDVYKIHSVVLCSVCNGLGFCEQERLTDYHRNDYDTFRTKCSKCFGDGRMIKVEIRWRLRGPSDHVQEMPYGEFNEIVEPHQTEHMWFRMRLDRHDINLENKYPELAAMTYGKYDELLKQYKVFDVLQRDSEKITKK